MRLGIGILVLCSSLAFAGKENYSPGEKYSRDQLEQMKEEDEAVEAGGRLLRRGAIWGGMYGLGMFVQKKGKFSKKLELHDEKIRSAEKALAEQRQIARQAKERKNLLEIEKVKIRENLKKAQSELEDLQQKRIFVYRDETLRSYRNTKLIEQRAELEAVDIRRNSLAGVRPDRMDGLYEVMAEVTEADRQATTLRQMGEGIGDFSEDRLKAKFDAILAGTSDEKIEELLARFKANEEIEALVAARIKAQGEVDAVIDHLTVYQKAEPGKGFLKRKEMAALVEVEYLQRTGGFSFDEAVILQKGLRNGISASDLERLRTTMVDARAAFALSGDSNHKDVKRFKSLSSSFLHGQLTTDSLLDELKKTKPGQKFVLPGENIEEYGKKVAQANTKVPSYQEVYSRFIGDLDPGHIETRIAERIERVANEPRRSAELEGRRDEATRNYEIAHNRTRDLGVDVQTAKADRQITQQLCKSAKESGELLKFMGGLGLVADIAVGWIQDTYYARTEKSVSGSVDKQKFCIEGEALAVSSEKKIEQNELNLLMQEVLSSDSSLEN